MEKNLKIHDTCGVHNLHGMPALIGVVLSCIMAAVATPKLYGDGLYVVYPAMETKHNVPEMSRMATDTRRTRLD